MPTVLRIGPHRFFFYAGDKDEPAHIHVEGADNVAKFWLDPVRLERSGGFGRRELSAIERIVKSIKQDSQRHGMSISRIEMDIPNADAVEVTDDSLTVELSDGRNISVPLGWYPRLLHGTPDERKKWRLIGGGQGIHWDELDEDVSVENLLAGRRSGESQQSYKRWLTSRASRP